MIGNVVEKYEVIQKVGEGGMATVYRGRHTTLGREVAIKVLHPHLSSSPRNRQRFAREARAIEHLQHENILRIFDYSGADTERCYIVTEFVDGVTLQQILDERGRFPSEVAAQLGIKLAEALGYAHSIGIIHRDLKLENVMLRRDGTLKLMDFGIARFLDEVNLTVTGALIGSPAYMSPEQAMERVLDSRSDLFSLGTLLFHLVTGQLPFAGSNPSIVLRNVIEGRRPGLLELAPDASSDLGDLVENLMQAEPDDRPQTAEEVAERLRGALESVGIGDENISWSPERWLQAPSDYEERLRAHMGQTLLERGKDALMQGDHITALRLLNRLLSIEPSNEEVLLLLRGMHSEPASSRRWPKVLPLALALLFAVIALAVSVWPKGPVGDPQADLQPVVTPIAEGDDDIDVESVPDDTQPIVVAAAPRPETPTDGRTGSRTKRPSPPPVPASPPTPAPEAATGESSTIIVTVPGSWGDIYIDGRSYGRTGQAGEIRVSPGTHTLRISNDHALPHQQSFTVEPGERRVIEVTDLQRKPVRYRLVDAPSEDCSVVLDGIRRGSVGTMDATILVREPERSHQLELSCPGETVITRTLSPAAPGSLVSIMLQE